MNVRFYTRKPGHDHFDFRIGERGFGYVGNSGGIGLMRCPECARENHSFNVSSGVCTWCGYDCNEKVEAALSARGKEQEVEDAS